MNDLKDLFKKKDLYHRKLAELPFEEKIKIVVKLQKIANRLKPSEKRILWKIASTSKKTNPRHIQG